VDLSIIIINWNSAGYVRKCVASIRRETRDLDYEIIVVDSASYDGCGEMLAREFPGVRFIQCDKNVGFARANNLGFDQSHGDCVLFLNPDTELVGPAINQLHRALMKLEDAGIVGARLLNTDGTLQTSCIQTFPTILNQVLDAEILRRVFPRLPFWGMAPLFVSNEEPAGVQMISGACMMMRRPAFERMGRFSEDYFMYSEDADLCYKSERSGCRNYYVPKAVIVHHGGGSSQQSRNEFSAVMMRESIWLYFTKTKGRPYGLCYRASMMLAAVCRLVLLALVFPVRWFFPGGASANGPFRTWLAIFNWSVGAVSWTKKPSECRP
jgi:GT2 family glycosyltransferase